MNPNGKYLEKKQVINNKPCMHNKIMEVKIQALVETQELIVLGQSNIVKKLFNNWHLIYLSYNLM